MITNTQVPSATTAQVFLATGQQAITTMIFCNTSGVTDTALNVYVVPFGSNAAPSTQIMKSVPIPAGETFVLDSERLILEDGDAIYAQATVNNLITATVSSLATGQ
jgi:hypothetical protein